MPETRDDDGLFRDAHGHARCAWCAATSVYQRYHDEEWGYPVADERRLFEKLCLEGFQAGLSWLTILNKREAFRAAMANFDAQTLACFGEAEVKRLLANAAIVRHRGKIEAAIGNARQMLVLRAEFGSFAHYVWRYAGQAGQGRPTRITSEALRGMTTSSASHALSRDLKRRGFRFVGPTTMQAFMQAMGLVNDHVEGCATRARAQAARAAFIVP